MQAMQMPIIVVPARSLGPVSWVQLNDGRIIVNEAALPAENKEE